MTNGCVTLAEAAQELGVHYMTVYRYVRTGKLPARQVGGEWQIDRADLAMSQTGPPAPAGPGRSAARTGPKPWRGRLEARLIAGDEAGAWALVEAALASGMKPEESLLDLVGPAMRSVGDHWENGEWSIADEHRATAVAARLVARLGSRFARRGVKRGTVVLAAPAGELHGLPVSIGANLLRWNGFNVVELGADTPPDALAEAVANVAGPDAAGPDAAGPDAAGPDGPDHIAPLAVGIVSTVTGTSPFGATLDRRGAPVAPRCPGAPGRSSCHQRVASPPARGGPLHRQARRRPSTRRRVHYGQAALKRLCRPWPRRVGA